MRAAQTVLIAGAIMRRRMASSSFVSMQASSRPVYRMPALVSRALFGPHAANDGPHQEEHEQPVAAVNPQEAPVAPGKAVVGEHRRHHEAKPAERGGDHAVAQ